MRVCLCVCVYKLEVDRNSISASAPKLVKFLVLAEFRFWPNLNILISAQFRFWPKTNSFIRLRPNNMHSCMRDCACITVYFI